MELKELAQLLDGLSISQAGDIDPDDGPMLQEWFELFDQPDFSFMDRGRAVGHHPNLSGLGIGIDRDRTGGVPGLLRRRWLSDLRCRRVILTFMLNPESLLSSQLGLLLEFWT